MKQPSKPQSTSTRPHKLNNITKPKELTLEEWQIALRRQQAQEEAFCIDTLAPGEYKVSNSKTRQEYKVVYRGEDSDWNYCSCMDFKTSHLGTCKHIEAVKLQEKHIYNNLPAYTSVYLDYRSGRKVKIRIGIDNAKEFRQLATKYFCKNGCIRKNAYSHFGKFLEEAKAINDTFRCYKDAMDFVIEKRGLEARKHIIDTKYDDQALDNLLKVQLFPYQKEGVRFAIKAGRAIIADEMGLGKTIQAIASAELLRKEGLIETALIITPTSLKYQWKREIEKFTGVTDIIVVEGTHLKRRDLYNSTATYKIVSYNAACNDIKILGKLKCDLLIMDEVQRLKNWNTQISRAARRIESDYSVILSGTPLENKLEELYSVVEFADQFLLSPYYKFREECILTDESGKVLGYKNLNAIGKRLQKVLIRRRKKDVNLQLPGRMDNNIFVPMTLEQKGMHDEFGNTVAQLVNKWRRLHFLSETDRKRLLLTLSQMRMVCDSTYILDQESRFDTKIDETLNILETIFESGKEEKVVIFSQWERMTRLVAQELDNRGIRYEYLHGGVPSAKRKDLVSNFTDIPEIRVFLSTDAGSTGLNLQVANTVINLDLPWNPAVLEQRIARIYRIGQQRNIQVINLVAANTIEENMISKLKFKTSMFEGVLDGGDDTVFAGDDKFTKIIDMVGAYVDESTMNGNKFDSANSSETDSASVPSGSTDIEITTSSDKTEHNEEVISQEDKEPERQETNQNHISEEITESQTEYSQKGLSSDNNAASTNGRPEDLVTRGISFLSDLAATLASPERTEALLDSIVEQDNETGRTSLRIPVPDRQTISNAVQIFGKLFSAMSQNK